jgi:hypothetical protein
MDLVDLRDLYRTPGDWLSLHLDASERDGSADAIPSAWAAILHRLHDDGVPPGLLDQARRACLDTALHGGTISVLTKLGRQPVVVQEPEPPRVDIGYFGGLPYALPLLDFGQGTHTHVVVDLTGDDERAAAVVTFPSGDLPVRNVVRVDRVEDLGGRVAAALPERCALTALFGAAERVTATARGIDPERAGRLLRYSTRPADGIDGVAADLDDLADDVVRQVATITAEETVEELERFRAASAANHAVQTPAAVASALRAGAVNALLIHDDPDDRRTAWCAEDPASVVVDRPDEPSGWHESRWGDVFARAALLQDARVRVIPSTGPRGPAGNVGAIVRMPVALIEQSEAAPSAHPL